MIIDLENNSGYTCNESLLISLINFSLTKLGIHPDSEISLRLVSENEMAELHKKWMGLVGPTDVLSFPMDEMLPNSLSNGPGIIGDIVLCPEYAEKNGKQSLSQELELLTLHGILHLLGYDHEEIEEEKIMFGIQEEYLNQWRALK
jgi:probable rRNA maturation factor